LHKKRNPAEFFIYGANAYDVVWFGHIPLFLKKQPPTIKLRKAFKEKK